MTKLDRYNEVNPIKDTKIVEFSGDTYKLEIRELSYHVIINGIESKSYKRLPTELKRFFGI